MLLNKEQVVHFLPHKDPFLFIDEVEAIDIPVELSKIKEIKDIIGTKVTAHFLVRESLEILKGHFPGNPILPGVIQIEMMAQAAAFSSLALNNLDVNGVCVDTLLLGSEACKFRKPIYPGMNLTITAVLEKCRGTVTQYGCEVFHDGHIIAQSKIMAKLDVKRKDV